MSFGIPRESLVQYEPPIEINQHSDTAKLGTLQKKVGQAPTIETKPNTEDILNAILPPREWDNDGKHYIQYVSHNPASREDVANLQKLLDERLLARQARYGIWRYFNDYLLLEKVAYAQLEKNCIANVSMK